MSASRKLRVGILGSSFGGSVHAPAFAAQGRFEVVAIASPNRAAEVAKARAIPHAFDTLDAMLDGTELDVISIAAPPFEHRTAVLAALRRDKHVLCEKPFGLNVAEAEEMVAAAKTAGTVCAVAHEFRYLPSRLALAELIANGHLGDLRAIEIAFASTMLGEAASRPNSWWFERARGGGITGAILSHNIDAASHLAGRAPVLAKGIERTAVPHRSFEGKPFTSDVADGAFVTIDYGNGLIATVSADGTHVVNSILTAVHGSRRTAVSSGENLGDLTTFVVESEETHELEIAASPHAKLAAAHGNLPAFVALLDAFAGRIDGGNAPIPTFEEALETQRVLAAVGYEAPSLQA